MTAATSFAKAFQNEMESLGLPVAPELFEHYQEAVSNAGQMAAVLALMNEEAQVSDLVRRTLGLEKLMIAGSLNAIDYTGAVIGCIGVASGELSGDPVQMSDLFRYTYQHQLQFPHWDRFFLRNPQVINPQAPHRRSFGCRAQLGA